jgi:hypothetical protein
MGNSFAYFCYAVSAAGYRHHVVPAMLTSDPTYGEGLWCSYYILLEIRWRRVLRGR